mmetsp:Transcript_26251/g.59998  ORF Transcript_26251/g.59998 Transcript_26251/m.59998 type:complete len:446 (+) Transcript_26251:254-1591(+)
MDKKEAPMADTTLRRRNGAISTSPYIQSDSRLRSKYLHDRRTENAVFESRAAEISRHNRLVLALWNSWSVLVLYVTALISIESVVGIGLTVAVTLVVYFNVSDDYEHDSSFGWNGNLPTVLLSFAVVTPLSSSITMAFNRRERALQQLATYRSSAYQLYCGHASWDWSEAHKKPGRRGCEEDEGDLAAVRGESGREQEQADEQGGGRNIDFLQHADTTLTHLVHLSDALYKYLSLPTASRARHRATKMGRREAAEVLTTGKRIFCSEIYGNMTMVSQQTEALKYRGMPGNEASRIRQWEEHMSTAIEQLRIIKEYRTLQALRVFGRLFSVLMPPLYATSYVQVALDSGSLALGLVIGIMHSLVLTGLFNCVAELEDPFMSDINLDGIDCREELVVLVHEELLCARRMMFPEAGEFVLKKDCFKGLDVSSDYNRTSRYNMQINEIK